MKLAEGRGQILLRSLEGASETGVEPASGPNAGAALLDRLGHVMAVMGVIRSVLSGG